MDPAAFLDDLEAKPRALRALVPTLGSSWMGIGRPRRIVLAGMGSSHFANVIAAARMRVHGLDATAVLASSDLRPPVEADDLVIIVSAGGFSVETKDAAEHYQGRARTILLTNVADAKIAPLVDQVVPMDAGPELGGVACRSFQHTLIRLLELQAQFAPGPDLAGLVNRTADATEDLLARRDAWLAPVTELLAGPDGTTMVAPARRLSSAQQSALMLREGPRRPAIACETGDWSHIDVYLTKTTDYRMLLLAGSRWEPELLRWCTERGSTVVAAGADVDSAAMSLRYRHDEDDDVRLLTEVLIAELVAQRLWAASAG
jgi:glucosamine--fructose-6-phosphate aminotransferase (isomerizing)